MKEADGDKLDLIQVLRADKKRLEKLSQEQAETISRMSAHAHGGGPDGAQDHLDSGTRPEGPRSPVSGRTNSGTILRATTPDRVTAPAVPSAPRSYQVASGDTLSTIAKKMYGQSSRWRDIYEANQDTMRSQNDLKIGQSLKIP